MAGLGPTQMGSSSTIGEGLSRAGIVWAFVAEIAAAFTPDGASMPTQAAGDFGIRVALPLHYIYDISLVHGKMVV